MALIRKPAGAEIIDLLDRVLDKGIVVEASSRLHLRNANLLRNHRHLVVAAVETHLRHSEARAVAKLDRSRPLPAEFPSRPAATAENSHRVHRIRIHR